MAIVDEPMVPARRNAKALQNNLHRVARRRLAATAPPPDAAL
jgi:hypothetical protein